MAFELYEFDEKWLPDNFENNIRCCVNFNLAFYLKKKYIVNDCDWFFEEDKKDGEEVVVYCPTNNEFFDIDKKIVEKQQCGCSCGTWGYKDAVCPNEGSCASTCYLKNAAYKHSDLERNYNFGFIQRTNRGAVLRVFKCKFDFSGERYELQREGEFNTLEAMRVFFNTDRTTEIYSRFNKQYGRYSGYFVSVGYQWKLKKRYQPYADFNNIGEFDGTLLKGFEKYFTLTKNFTTDDAMRTVLLLAMFKFPALKHLIKAGFSQIVEECTVSLLDDSGVNGKLPFNYKAKTIKQFFNFEISKLNCISEEQRENLSVFELPNLREMDRLGIQFTEENYIMGTSSYFKDLLAMIGDEELKHAIKYLRGQTDIKLDNRVNDYYDYLSQACLLKLNLKNTQVRYPKSLKRAHERLSAQVKYTESPILCNKFRMQTKRFEEYSFRQGRLSLRAVRTVSELKIWAERFDNCSGGYVDRIADGNSMIFVIVDRFKPKQAYFMLEYNPKTGRIVQCRGYNNDTDMDDEPIVSNFCSKWLEYIKVKKSVS